MGFIDSTVTAEYEIGLKKYKRDEPAPESEQDRHLVLHKGSQTNPRQRTKIVHDHKMAKEHVAKDQLTVCGRKQKEADAITGSFRHQF